MASLHKLLSQDGFHPHDNSSKKVKFRDKKKTQQQQQDFTLPIYICHDRRSFDSSNQHQRPRSVAASSVASRKSRDEPAAIDDAAVRAVVAILSGYAGRYLKDAGFRSSIRDKCRSCFERRRRKGSSDGGEAFTIMEAGIQSVERLVEGEEMDLESLQRCIKILNAVASSSDPPPPPSASPSRRKTTSHLAACANLYLSVVYKASKNDKISARNLLQVFCDAPSLARTRLLPELWDHFFLPHLLHLKIWYGNELENLATMEDDAQKQRRIKRLNHLYHDQMDVGTLQFALYYKEWLKVGAQPPPLPTVSLPPKSRSKSRSRSRSRRKSSESSLSHHSSSSKLL